jgi:hypothetical protein
MVISRRQQLLEALDCGLICSTFSCGCPYGGGVGRVYGQGSDAVAFSFTTDVAARPLPRGDADADGHKAVSSRVKVWSNEICLVLLTKASGHRNAACAAG